MMTFNDLRSYFTKGILPKWKNAFGASGNALFSIVVSLTCTFVRCAAYITIAVEFLFLMLMYIVAGLALRLFLATFNAGVTNDSNLNLHLPIF